MKIRIFSGVLALCIVASVVFGVDKADEDFSFAKNLMGDRQEYDLAAKKFAEFVKANPRHEKAAEALSYMGYCYSLLKKDGAAAASYSKLVHEYPTATEILRQEAMAYGGDAYFKLKKFELAVKMYSELLKDYPLSKYSEGALYWRGESFYRLAGGVAGDQARATQWRALIDKAIADYEAFVRRYPASKKLPAALYSAGFAYYDTAAYEKAAEYFSKLVKEFPQDSRSEESLLYIAECKYRQKQYDLARQAYGALAKKFPGGAFAAEAKSGMAWCDYASGKILEAAQGFVEAAALTADNEEKSLNHRYDAGCAFREAGRFDEAGRELAYVVARPNHPLYPSALFKLGAFRLEQAKGIEEKLAKAAKGSPEAASLSSHRRRILAEAAGSLKKCLQVGGAEAAEAGTFLGETYLDLGRYAEAAQAFGTVAENFPKDERAPWALYHMALALREQDKIAEAKDALKKLFANYPNSKLRLQAAYAVASYQDMLKNREKSRQAYEYIAQKGVLWAEGWKDKAGKPDAALIAKAKELAADSLYRLGESYYPKEDPAKAARYYRLVVERYPKGAQAAMALLRLGELAEASKDYEGATFHYSAVLSCCKEGAPFKHALYRLGAINLMLGQGASDQAKKREFLESSLSSLNRFVAAYPKDELAVKAGYYRAEAFYALGRKKEARKEYEAVYKADAAGEFAAASLFGLGWCKRDLGEKGAGRGEFQSLVDRFPKSKYVPDSLYVLVCDKFEAKDFRGALADANTIIDTYPQSAFAARALVEKGRALDALERREEAVAVFEQFLKKYPGHADEARAMYSMSWAIWGIAEPTVIKAREAEQAYRRVIGLSKPEDLDEVSLKKAVDLKRKRDELEAMVKPRLDRMTDVLASLVEKHKKFDLLDAAWLRLGEVAYDRRDYADAFKKYESAYAAASTRKGSDIGDKAQYRISWCLLRMAEEAERTAQSDVEKSKVKQIRRQAIRAFEKLATEFPKSELASESYFRAAELRREYEDYKGAMAEYAHALRLSPKSSFAQAAGYGLGLCLLETEQYPKALEQFSKVLADYPSGDFVHEASWGAGQAALMIKAYADAGEHFEKALSGDYAGEAAAKARYGIGLIALDQGKWEAAREEFLKVDAFHGQWTEWAARALLKSSFASKKLGQADKAKKDLEIIIKRYANTKAAAEAKAELQNIG